MDGVKKEVEGNDKSLCGFGETGEIIPRKGGVGGSSWGPWSQKGLKCFLGHYGGWVWDRGRETGS